ncbi:hypothetical protein [Pseudomonas sp. BN411]|nr:hypothetical protein [Pseudomonas sp. BN411]
MTRPDAQPRRLRLPDGSRLQTARSIPVRGNYVDFTRSTQHEAA